MTVRRFASHAEADAADLACWREISDAYALGLHGRPRATGRFKDLADTKGLT